MRMKSSFRLRILVSAAHLLIFILFTASRAAASAQASDAADESAGRFVINLQELLAPAVRS
jgi:hypothetical protein